MSLSLVQFLIITLFPSNFSTSLRQYLIEMGGSKVEMFKFMNERLWKLDYIQLGTNFVCWQDNTLVDFNRGINIK